MQISNKVSQQQLTGVSGQPVTALRFTGDISSASKEIVLGTYESLDKAIHNRSCSTVKASITSTPPASRSSSRFLWSRQVRPKDRNLRSYTPLHFTKVFTMVGITKYATLYPDEPAALASL